jgi:hypothetical protein
LPKFVWNNWTRDAITGSIDFGLMELSMDSSLPLIVRRWSAGRKRRRFAFLGFLTGFALSVAIGAVLYMYLAVG